MVAVWTPPRTNVGLLLWDDMGGENDNAREQIVVLGCCCCVREMVLKGIPVFAYGLPMVPAGLKSWWALGPNQN